MAQLSFRFTAEDFKVYEIESKSWLTYFFYNGTEQVFYSLKNGLVKVAESCKRKLKGFVQRSITKRNMSAFDIETLHIAQKHRERFFRRQIYISKPNSTMLLNGRRIETITSVSQKDLCRLLWYLSHASCELWWFLSCSEFPCQSLIARWSVDHFGSLSQNSDAQALYWLNSIG